MDLRAGTSVATGSGPGQNDGRARGSVKLNVGSNDAAIEVASGIRIAGAGDLQVNAFRSYDSAPLASAPDVHGHRPQVINQQWLDTVVDLDNSLWMNAALANTGLQQRTAACSYRLRPGVQLARAAMTIRVATWWWPVISICPATATDRSRTGLIQRAVASVNRPRSCCAPRAISTSTAASTTVSHRRLPTRMRTAGCCWKGGARLAEHRIWWRSDRAWRGRQAPDRH